MVSDLQLTRKIKSHKHSIQTLLLRQLSLSLTKLTCPQQNLESFKNASPPGACFILSFLPTIHLLHRPQAPPCRVEQLLLGLSLPSLNDRAGRTLALYNAKAMGAAPLPHGHFVGRRGLDQGQLQAGRFTFQHLSLVPRKDWFLAKIHLCCSFWFQDQDEQF